MSIEDQNSPNGGKKPVRGGGFFIAMAMIIGIIGGIFARQISAGMVIGLAVGIVVAVLLWLLERGR